MGHCYWGKGPDLVAVHLKAMGSVDKHDEDNADDADCEFWT